MILIDELGNKVRGYIGKKKLEKRSKEFTNFYNSYSPKALSFKTEKPQIVVSLTSFPKRFKYVKYSIYSLLNQTIRPDRIILYIDDTVSESDIQELSDLISLGVEIEKRPYNIKPHKKYFFAFLEHKNDIIITVDDDLMYDVCLVESLVKSYKKYPYAISAARVHKITFNSKHDVRQYNKWKSNVNDRKPRMDLFATGVGGVLYPPYLLEKTNVLDIASILKYSVDNDDIWLKFCELEAGIPVVKVKCGMYGQIPGTQEIALSHRNVTTNLNDEIINRLIAIKEIDLFEKCHYNYSKD